MSSTSIGPRASRLYVPVHQSKLGIEKPDGDAHSTAQTQFYGALDVRQVLNDAGHTALAKYLDGLSLDADQANNLANRLAEHLPGLAEPASGAPLSLSACGQIAAPWLGMQLLICCMPQPWSR
jgi:hypothetical protein